MRTPSPSLLDYSERRAEILAAAHRERAHAVHRYLIAPIVRLFADQPPVRHTRMLHRSAW